ncbi:unnamed protein product [Linum trigynum]|uniref:Uncharacterized protein n=1 Tax=Linum trigynum TaxID=586398 RepID=A0AAV2G5X1_9ROSI
MQFRLRGGKGRVNGEREIDLDDVASGSGDVRLHRFLHGAVPGVESALGEGPGAVLEEDRGGGGGVVDEMEAARDGGSL